MWIVKAICKDGYPVSKLNVHRIEEIENAKRYLQVVYKPQTVEVEEYMPWTKERAEEEIRQKKIKLGLIKEEKPKRKKSKVKE